MKSKTKKILLAVGGITLGVATAATGGGLLGMGLAGILIRTGVLKAAPAASKESLKILTSTGFIAANLVKGAVCSVGGITLAADSGEALGTALRKNDGFEVVVQADPVESETRSVIVTQ